MSFPFPAIITNCGCGCGLARFDPDEDVRLIVVPPPFMVETLRKGQVDGFCVGRAVELAGGRGGRRDHPPSGHRHRPRLPGKGAGLPGRMGAGRMKTRSGPWRQAIGDASRWAAEPGNRSALVDPAREHGRARRDRRDDRNECSTRCRLAPPAPRWRPPACGSTKTRSRLIPPRRFGSTPRWWRPVRPPIRKLLPKPRLPSMRRLSGHRCTAATHARCVRRSGIFAGRHSVPTSAALEGAADRGVIHKRAVRCTVSAQSVQQFWQICHAPMSREAQDETAAGGRKRGNRARSAIGT